MTNLELADWLNSKLTLHDGERISVNVVRQWVNWNLLPRASITGRNSLHGPIWQRDDNALTKALRLAELRKQGLIKRDQLIARCFVDGWKIDLAAARSATFSRVKFITSSMNKRLTVDYSKIDAVAGPTAVQARALQNQLGSQDLRFKDTPFEISQAQGVLLNLSALTGNHVPQESVAAIIPALRLEGPLQNHWLEFLPIFAAGIAGMSGAPDEIENSLLGSIENCSEEIFLHSRNRVCELFSNAKDVQISDLAKANFGDLAIQVFESLAPLDRTEWPVLIFAFWCHASHVSGTKFSSFGHNLMNN